MKTSKVIIIVAILTLFLAGSLMADGGGIMNWGNDNNPMMGQGPNSVPVSPGPSGPTAPPGPGNTPQVPPNLVWQFPRQPVSPAERYGLVQLRQEMKLARDVSWALYNRWQQPAFLNSANAQQAQMDTMKALLDKYGIADPVVDNTPGIFMDPHYLELYNAMAAKGMTSLGNAMSVGATVEERAIYTVNNIMATADNDDMQAVYLNMMAGSRNYLRVFVGMMAGQGMYYNPQYISHDEMEEIMMMPWQ